MSLMTCASGESVYRGYEYYTEGKVSEIQTKAKGQFEGTVQGTNKNSYKVFIDIAHPRKSHCNCPHANGKRIVCKHQIALYFSVFPDEAKSYIKELESYWDEEEKRHEDEEEAISRFLDQCKKDDLKGIIWQMLFDGPEWQYDKFLREYLNR